MFDRYTEPARLVIFHARLEASKDGSGEIELPHLRAALLREHEYLFERLGLPTAYSMIPKGPPTPTTVDMALSPSAKRVLGFAAEAAGPGEIRPEHLLLGILREQGEPLEPMPAEIGNAVLDRFQALIWGRGANLRHMSDEDASRPTREGAWSPKQILGHLIDSAANNHQRFVRAQLEPFYLCPGYAQSEWVDLQHYQQAAWRPLVDLWSAYNRHLLRIAAAIPEEALKHQVKIADHDPVTLAFLIEDYIQHAEHHLTQIGV